MLAKTISLDPEANKCGLWLNFMLLTGEPWSFLVFAKPKLTFDMLSLLFIMLVTSHKLIVPS